MPDDTHGWRVAQEKRRGVSGYLIRDQNLDSSCPKSKRPESIIRSLAELNMCTIYPMLGSRDGRTENPRRAGRTMGS